LSVKRRGNSIVYGTTALWPDARALVRSIGYKSAKLPGNALHTPAVISASGTDEILPAVAYIQQASGAVPRLVLGWKADSTYGIDKLDTTVTAIFNTQNFQVGKRFNIRKITIPLSGAVGASTSIAPIIRFDTGSGAKTLPVINNTNYSGLTVIVYHGSDIEAATTTTYIGQTNFYIEFTWTASNAVGIMPGIETSSCISKCPLRNTRTI